MATTDDGMNVKKDRSVKRTSGKKPVDWSELNKIKSRRVELKALEISQKQLIVDRNERLLEEILNAPAPEEINQDYILWMAQNVYRLSVVNKEFRSAIAATTLIADIKGLRINRTQIGTPDDFAKAETEKQVRDIIEQRSGKVGAQIFDAVVEGWADAGIIDVTPEQPAKQQQSLPPPAAKPRKRNGKGRVPTNRVVYPDWKKPKDESAPS